MTPIIGGKADGGKCPIKVPRMEQDGDIYMLVSFRVSEEEAKKFGRYKAGEHFFYQLAGMKPAEAHGIFLHRYAKDDLEFFR